MPPLTDDYLSELPGLLRLLNTAKLVNAVCHAGISSLVRVYSGPYYRIAALSVALDYLASINLSIN